MVYSYSYLSVIFKVSWSTDVAQNFQNSLIRSIHILASLIYSPGICFYDKYKDSFTHVRVLLYIWYGETIVLYNMVVQLFFFFFSFLSCHASMRRYGSRIPTIF